MIRSLSHLSILNISAGVAYSAAVSVEGNLFTWGYGGHGQLGHNDQKNYSQPFMVKSMSDEIVTKVEAAYGHTLCLTATGELFAWGSGHGLLGLR
jgi:alpha-tubulin suppressor-like RCC1 family protein